MKLANPGFAAQLVQGPGKPPELAPSPSATTPQTLGGVLGKLAENPPLELPMLRSTAAKLAEFFARPADEIPFEMVPDCLVEFRLYLTRHGYARNSIRSYMNYVNILMAKVEGLGWDRIASEVPSTWAPLADWTKERGSLQLVRHLAKRGLSPANVRESDIYDWVRAAVRDGASYTNTRRSASRLRRCLVDAGFSSKLAIKRIQQKQYGIPLEEFPQVLRAEVQEVLRWKQDRFVPSRPKSAQVRAITARRIQHLISRLYGFLVSIEGNQEIYTLRQLVTEQNVSRYISWSLNERKVQGLGLSVNLGGLYASLRHNPKFSDVCSPWMEELLRSIPEDSDQEALQRKEEKYLPYSLLSSIPHLIRDERKRIPRTQLRAHALSVRNELLVRWLLVLPWRQRNIRECRVCGENPNLFRGVLGKVASVTRPDWLHAAEQENGSAEVWQFRFAPDETKTGNNVHCVLPARLVPLLEEYLTIHRPRLVRGRDPDTLFLNSLGKPLSADMVIKVVSQLTLKYGGRIVTPHLFRDIFAFMWLELAPEDYLTLSKLLWHRNIQTTIRTYGRRFNESTALCRMERLLPN